MCTEKTTAISVIANVKKSVIVTAFITLKCDLPLSGITGYLARFKRVSELCIHAGVKLVG